MLKKLGQLILIPILLIGGYGLVVPLFIFFVAGTAYAVIYLVAETIYNPSWFIYVCDVLFLVGLFFLFKSNKFKSGVREFWFQFKGNM